MIEIFISNLRKYNEGKLVGEWITLPATEDELEEVYEKIGDGEVFISDYTAPFEIKENDNISKLNEIAEVLEASKIDEHCAEALFSMFYDKNEVLDVINSGNFNWYEGQTIEDFARSVLEENYGNNEVYENLSTYIDIEAYARDLTANDLFLETKYGVLEIYY